MFNIPPAWLLILGALLLPLFTGRSRNCFLLFVTALAFAWIVALEPGSYLRVQFFGFDLTLLRVDKLSKFFGYIFTLYGFAGCLYAFYLRDMRQHLAALLYIGSALGVIFSGDLVSLYFYWEIMAVASVILVLAGGSEKSYAAGYRYVLVHIFGGLCLLLGIVLFIHNTGSVNFSAFSEYNLSTYLILLGILINTAAVPLHAWLPDAYPEATVTGSVVLSAFTTKTAVYTLIRGFPGWEILVLVGCIMTIYGLVYALMENDIRRILAYFIINQVGFKVVGVGIGTAMALNGASVHAFAHIIYKGLMFMAAGSVIYMTGKKKCTDLGGLYKSMPWTTIFCCIGALSMSALPLTSGFTTKSMIVVGAEHEHMFWTWLVLQIASAGAFLLASLKFPYFIFFGEDKGFRPGESNWTMLTAMGLLAFLCILIGVYPDVLYGILPFDAHAYHPYTASHLSTKLQLIMFSALAFFLLLPLLGKTRTISLDTDWFYRKGFQVAYSGISKFFTGLNNISEKSMLGIVRWLAVFFKDASTRLVMYVMITLWLLSGERGTKLEMRKRNLYLDMHKGTVPVGVGATLATIFIVLVFMLN